MFAKKLSMETFWKHLDVCDAIIFKVKMFKRTFV